MIYDYQFYIRNNLATPSAPPMLPPIHANERFNFGKDNSIKKISKMMRVLQSNIAMLTMYNDEEIHSKYYVYKKRLSNVYRKIVTLKVRIMRNEDVEKTRKQLKYLKREFNRLEAILRKQGKFNPEVIRYGRRKYGKGSRKFQEINAQKDKRG